MGQLIMRWKNDGKPDVGFSLPENCTVTTFSRLENAMDHWLDLMQYGLTEGKRDEAFYREAMTARPNYREDRCFFVLEQDTPVATVAVLCDNEKKEGYVHMVACRTEARGKGYGTLLNRIVCRELKNAGMETAYLTTDDWRIPAIRSYLRAGFVPDLSTEDFEVRWRSIFQKIGEIKGPKAT